MSALWKTTGWLAGTSATALMFALPAVAADQLTAVTYGGVAGSSIRKAMFEPFVKATGTRLTEDEYNGEIAKIRAMVKAASVTWDVVETGGAAEALCSEGTVEKIDWKKLGLEPSKFMAGDFACGVPTVVSGTVVAYDRDKLPNGPKVMADLFDLQKFPGKRGLIKNPKDTLEWALIADGVPVKDVYKVLRTPEGVDRAFRKLDTIKKDVVWWTSGAQQPQLLADGQVVMTMAWNGRIYDANKNAGKNFAIVWDSQIPDVGWWVIPKGSPNLDVAYKFLAFASSAQAQAERAKYVPYGPTNKDALAQVDPSVRPYLPTTPEHLRSAGWSEALWTEKRTFWVEKGDEMRARFNAWVAK